MALLPFDEIKTRVHITDVLSNYFDKDQLQLPQDKTQLGVLEFFPRKRTKTAGALALPTSPEGVTFFTKFEI